MGRLDALEDLPCEKVSREVYIYYLKALGASPVSFAMVLYVLYQVHTVHVFYEGHKNRKNLHHQFDTYLVNVKLTVKIWSIFVAFIENMNFNLQTRPRLRATVSNNELLILR